MRFEPNISHLHTAFVTKMTLVVAATYFECMHCIFLCFCFKILECCLEFKNDSCQPEDRYSTQQELNDGPAKESTGLRF